MTLLSPFSFFTNFGFTNFGQNFSLASWLGVEPSLTIGAFLGIILASFIYLLSTWLAMRDRSQIFLMLMLLCLMAHVAAAHGSADAFGNNPLLEQFVKQAALILFYIFSAMFTLIYLELDVIGARIRYLLYAFATLLVGALLLAAVDSSFLDRYLSAIGIAVLSCILVAGITGLAHRVSGSMAHLFAFGVVFVGTLGESQGQSRDATAIAYALCALLFAVVIASQFARRQEMKERELATSNERFQMAAKGSNEGLYDWDMARQEGYFSDRLKHIFGISLSKPVHAFRAWMRLIHPKDRASVRKALFAFLRDSSKPAIKLDYRIKRPDGQVLWITSTGVAVRGRLNGHVIRLIGSVGDITEKKRAETRLRASEIRFRSIAEAHPVPVLIATLRDGEILYASRGAEPVFGISIDHLVGLSLDRFFANSMERRSLMEDVQEHGAVDLRETLLQRSDQSTFYAAISARVIEYERHACAVLGVYDITERKVAEEKIHSQEVALQQSEKLAALGGLLAGVAHELNNPLSVIVGQAVLLKESAKDEKTIGRAEKIHKAGERCGRIVRSFLALARRKPPERTSVSINEVIEGSLELIAFQLRTDNVELVKKLEQNMPPALADSDQMTQVITNLVINAKQALQDQKTLRKITVESWYSKDDATIHVAVTDNGPGVPPEIAHRIFEPFFTTKPAGSGTGVGLSLCFNVIEGHGGHIWVEDAKQGGAERGARFVFTLPAMQAPALIGANLGGAVRVANSKIPPQRILIVDDEIELGQTLADILSPDGHSITQVDNGQQALDALAKQDYDAIISDLRMPVLDGPGLYRALERTKPAYLSRILFVTGDTLSIPVREFLESYALDVIEKPYTPDEVRGKLALLIKGLSNAAPQQRSPLATQPLS